jgi:minor extracellular serine protease Vpr
MKKIYILLLSGVFFATSMAQNTVTVQAKLSPLTKKYLLALKASNSSEAPSGFAYKIHNDGQVYLTALIEVADAPYVTSELERIGAKVGTRAGEIWTVQVPYAKAIEFTRIAGISYIQMDEPVEPSMDVARKTTRADSVQKGINLPMKYSGKGVIVGVIDFGFDYQHPAFYDTLQSAYRIKRVWELNTKGTPPTGYSYGHELKDSNSIRAQGTDNAKQTHGTCVAGMAAGSGFGSTGNSQYRGMAYDADLVFVGVRRDTIARQWLQGTFTDFLDGINYIFTYAQSQGKPCVINVSWGSQSGPHDGSTLFNRACNNMTGPGKILVMSAGNDGEAKIHLNKTFTPSDTVINTFLTFSSNVYKRTWVDVWGEQGKTFCGKVTLYSRNNPGTTTEFQCIDNGVKDRILISANGKDTCFVQFISSNAEYNGKPRMTIDIYNRAKDSVGVSISSASGNIHLWNEYYYYGYTYGYQCEFSNLNKTWAVAGNTATTVSDMGAADSVLLIGAYASKVAYKDLNGNSWSYGAYVAAGRLAPFSSRGPMTDGRIKPDITAPGITIATAVSSFDTAYTPTGSSKKQVVFVYNDPRTGKKFYFSEFTGTSAAGPAASGIVALMMQARPTLGPKHARNIIAKTALKDPYMGNIPAIGNNNWGHGKINAYGAMKAVIAGVTNIDDVSVSGNDFELYPNPGNGLFTLNYTGTGTQPMQLEVYNMMGSRLFYNNWTPGLSANLYPIDLSSCAGGTYLLRISTAEGFQTVKIVVQ